jgi:hypothetical protein
MIDLADQPVRRPGAEIRTAAGMAKTTPFRRKDAVATGAASNRVPVPLLALPFPPRVDSACLRAEAVSSSMPSNRLDFEIDKEPEAGRGGFKPTPQTGARQPPARQPTGDDADKGEEKDPRVSGRRAAAWIVERYAAAGTSMATDQLEASDFFAKRL